MMFHLEKAPITRPNPEHSESVQFTAGLLYDFPEIIIVPLEAGGKRPAQKFQRARKKNNQWNTNTKISIFRGWLRAGRNVGLVLHQTGLWVLDLDAESGWPSTVDDAIAELKPPQVRTPSGGRHCYFALPADLIGHPHLKAHVVHPTIDGIKIPLDLKLGGRQTLVVAAGSQKGSNRYLPLTPWKQPPVLDPRKLFPSISMLHEHADQPFDVDQRPLEDRLARGKAYLQKRAPVSVSTKQGSATLHRVCTHLVCYLRIPVHTALTLLTTPLGNSWNDRCRDGKTGHPYPWSTDELHTALEGAKGSVPTFGVLQRQLRIENERVITRLDLACEILLSSYTAGEGNAIPIEQIHVIFQMTANIPTTLCSSCRFGKYLRDKGLIRIRKGTKRRWHLMLTVTLHVIEQQFREAFAFDADDSPSNESRRQNLGRTT